MSDFELPADKKSVRRQGASKPISDEEIKSKIRTEEQATMVSPDEEGPKKEEPKYSEDELLNIFDEIIFQGNYEENISVKNGKLKIAFRTRTAGEYSAITDELDATKANLISTLSEKRQLLNLHYALTKYQGQNLGNMKFDERVKFINQLASPMVGLLINALAKFDEKIFEACKFGEQNQNF